MPSPQLTGLDIDGSRMRIGTLFLMDSTYAPSPFCVPGSQCCRHLTWPSPRTDRGQAEPAPRCLLKIPMGDFFRPSRVWRISRWCLTASTAKSGQHVTLLYDIKNVADPPAGLHILELLLPSCGVLHRQLGLSGEEHMRRGIHSANQR
jgi:hypothetical protein